ncbi:MAG TPA: hypothetical protein VMU84_11720, partial [Thermoanaerobaculia bacterium]|nr:hypothetical protein [Thermoanaerobaculia bacterium]
MADITIINWDKVKDSFIDKTLATLKDATVANADVSAAPKVGIEGVELSFDASAKLTISAFNESTDTDDEQVVGVAGSKTADGDTLDPKIPYIAENAWLRYSLVGELTAGVKASLNAVGVGVDAESQIVFSDYRVHKPADAADTTVLSDLAAPRTALKIDDIRDLGNSEALYYELRGKLAFSVTVSWSDIYTKTLS